MLYRNRTEIISKIIRNNHPEKISKILVIGCGDGAEAAILSYEIECEVTGIDIVDNFNEEAAAYASLMKGDAMSLDFEDESFDFIYSYHSLEHIKRPQVALQEMERVLKNDGGFWIGTPRRSRLIGYWVGEDISFSKKFIWNIADYKARIMGRFRNEFGAHAGFTTNELSSLLDSVFFNYDDITLTYYHELYPTYTVVLNILDKTKLSQFIFPSIYFMGRKG